MTSNARGAARKDTVMMAADRDNAIAGASETDPTVQIQSVLEEAGIYVGAEIRDGVLYLSGEVDSPANMEAALDVAFAIAEPLGMQVVNDLELLDITVEGYAYQVSDADVVLKGTEPARHLELEPDFASEVGTTSEKDSELEGEVFFAPTDPVVGVRQGFDEVDFIGGFSDTSMDGLGDDAPPRGDEEIADDVRRELLEDALTTEMNIEVEVRQGVAILRGVVESMDDAENAEAVAARTPGVVEVREELTVLDLQGPRH
jgi:osmotically-inducible protein OsmY